MAISVQQLNQGDANYIAKHNANLAAIKAAVDALQAAQGGQAAAVNVGTALQALFGPAPAVIGAGSYACAIDGETVEVAPGFAWLPTISAVVRLAAAAELDLTGQPDGLYYIVADASGAPSYGTDPLNALYSFTKAGAVLSDLTRVAVVAWGQADWLAAQASSTLGAFTSLDSRLEAIEAAGSPLFVTGAFVAGKPANAALLFAILPSVEASFPAGFAGARAKAGVAATAATVLPIKKNGIQVGSITFAAGSAVGVFAAAAEVVVGIADELTIENQAVADATLADIRFALHGKR
jgi:hypothetical protein